MKQNDIIQIVVVGFLALVIALVLSSVVFNPSSKKGQKRNIVTPISKDFKSPDKRFFNENSVNPTQVIRIGENTNQKPFN